MTKLEKLINTLLKNKEACDIVFFINTRKDGGKYFAELDEIMNKNSCHLVDGYEKRWTGETEVEAFLYSSVSSMLDKEEFLSTIKKGFEREVLRDIFFLKKSDIDDFLRESSSLGVNADMKQEGSFEVSKLLDNEKSLLFYFYDHTTKFSLEREKNILKEES